MQMVVQPAAIVFDKKQRKSVKSQSHIIIICCLGGFDFCAFVI
jgi:hypothetical protein